MISREQVADLRAGDVVEVGKPEWVVGTVMRGVLVCRSDGLYVGDMQIQWNGMAGGDQRIAWMLDDGASLTVIERAPRPLYVNHDRAEPVPGDVVRDEDDPTTWCFFMSGTKHGTWMSNKAVFTAPAYMPKRLRLLVDGETGQVVP